MAPPHKRRRLSLLDPPSSPSSSGETALEPQATHVHSVTDLTYNSELSGTRSVPTRIEEIHLQIQQRAAGSEQNPPHRRQNLNSIIPTIGGPSSSSSASNSATTHPTTTGGTISSSSAPASVSSSSLFPSLSSVGVSGNGTAKHTIHSTTLPLTYLATLTNSNIKTITRSPKPYVTTFGDGQISTICNPYGDCKTDKDTSTKSPDSTPFLSQATSPAPSSAAAVVTASPSPTTPATSASSTSSVTHHHATSSAAPPPATIAGGAVGGIAGIAFLFVLALIFVRLYKRKIQNGHHARPAGDGMGSSGQSGMMERAGLTSLANVLPPLFRHQNKAQTPPSSSSAEVGFTKVSGRKLPSVWSEGMTREELNHSSPPDMPLKNNQSTPYLIDRDSAGFSDSDGLYSLRGTGSISPDPSPFADQGTSPVSMTLSPGPQRTPTFVHEPGPYVMPSMLRPPPPPPPPPPQQYVRGRAPSQQPPPGGRSESPSTTGDRNSRFTEDV